MLIMTVLSFRDVFKIFSVNTAINTHLFYGFGEMALLALGLWFSNGFSDLIIRAFWYKNIIDIQPPLSLSRADVFLDSK